MREAAYMLVLAEHEQVAPPSLACPNRGPAPCLFQEALPVGLHPLVVLLPSRRLRTLNASRVGGALRLALLPVPGGEDLPVVQLRQHPELPLPQTDVVPRDGGDSDPGADIGDLDQRAQIRTMPVGDLGGARRDPGRVPQVTPTLLGDLEEARVAASLGRWPVLREPLEGTLRRSPEWNPAPTVGLRAKGLAQAVHELHPPCGTAIARLYHHVYREHPLRRRPPGQLLQLICSGQPHPALRLPVQPATQTRRVAVSRSRCTSCRT
jgi:hypothetical protein